MAGGRVGWFGIGFPCRRAGPVHIMNEIAPVGTDSFGWTGVLVHIWSRGMEFAVVSLLVGFAVVSLLVGSAVVNLLVGSAVVNLLVGSAVVNLLVGFVGGGVARSQVQGGAVGERLTQIFAQIEVSISEELLGNIDKGVDAAGSDASVVSGRRGCTGGEQVADLEDLHGSVSWEERGQSGHGVGQ